MHPARSLGTIASMIALKNVSKSYHRKRVLTDISLQVDPGEFVCITGLSGTGKSTLIHLLAGVEEASSGRIEVDGVDLRAVPPIAMRLFRQRVGVVFQDYKLLSHYTVRENIGYPLEVCGAPQAAIVKRVGELLTELKLTRKADALPRELSGGEQARTAIARALAHEPMILFADEPTGNLDPEQSEKILKLFLGINKKGTTVVLATHDAALVDVLQTRVITLDDGKIVRDSRGSYREHKGQTHQILEEQPEKRPKTAAGARRKVRITAIGS